MPVPKEPVLSIISHQIVRMAMQNGHIIVNGIQHDILKLAARRCGTTALAVLFTLCGNQSPNTISLERAMHMLENPKMGDAILFSMNLDLSFGGHAWVMHYEPSGWAVYQSFLGHRQPWRISVNGNLMVQALRRAQTDTRDVFDLLQCQSFVPLGNLPGYFAMKCTSNRSAVAIPSPRSRFLSFGFMLCVFMLFGMAYWKRRS